MWPVIRIVRRAVVAAVVVGLAACTQTEPSPPDLGPLPLQAWIATNLPDGGDATYNPALEEAIAACMAAQGFTYVPVRPPEVEPLVFEEPPGPVRGTRAFAKRYGYGVAWQSEKYPPHSEEAAEPDPTDPNQQLLASMSDTERAAYEFALFGTMNDAPDPDEGPQPSRWQDWACSGQARWDHGRAGLAYLDPGWAEVSEELAGVDVAVEGHTDVLAARSQWRECMVAEGFGEWRVPEEAMSSFWGEIPGLFYDENGVPRDQPDLEPLAERERAAAVADWDCRAKSDYDARLHAARSELEAEVLERLGPELDAWLDSYWRDAGSG